MPQSFTNRNSALPRLPGNGGTISFKYDPLGRRIEKISPANTTVYAEACPERSRRDGDNVVEELSGSGTPVAQYTQGPGIDEPLAMNRASATSFYQADGLGSVTPLTNGPGQIAASYTYDSFGNLTASTGTISNPFRFTARDYDSETGLYYYRARYYDATNGRFLSEDPSIFEGGTNYYGYVENDPTSWLDPFGLRKQKSRTRTKPPVDACPKEKRCFFNWLAGPLGKMAQDLDTTQTLMLTMAAKEGGWSANALGHNMPLNNPFGVNRIAHGEAAGNVAYPNLSAAIDYWEKTFGNRVQGDKDPTDFVYDLQNPDPPAKPYNTADDRYQERFEEVYKAVVKFMKLCGICL